MSEHKQNDKIVNKLLNNQKTNNSNVKSNQQLSRLSSNERQIGVKDVNEMIVCFLCKGYLIDATTLVECLHSFCKTCIITHLESNTPKSRFCPRCDQQIHKTKPKSSIRSDPTLQDMVYKLVPGLYKDEMNRRKDFYSKEHESVIGLSNEERGEMSGERLIFTPEDFIYLSIEYFPEVISYPLLPFSNSSNNGALNCLTINDGNDDNHRRYLKCEGGMRVLQLKKWLRNKYDLPEHYDIEIMYKHECLLEDYTMMDLAYAFSWRRNGPLCLYYKIIEPQKQTDESYFKPLLVPKRRHTVKHKHKPNNKKKKLVINESNLITTNPVNEPLIPVDTTLINTVVANNAIETGVKISANNNDNVFNNPTASDIKNSKNNNNNSFNRIQSQLINTSVPKPTKISDNKSKVKNNNNCIEMNGLMKTKTIANKVINDVIKKKTNNCNKVESNSNNITKAKLTPTLNNSITDTNNGFNSVKNISQTKVNYNHMNNKVLDLKKVTNTDPSFNNSNKDITITNSSKTAVNPKLVNDSEDKSNGVKNCSPNMNSDKNVKMCAVKPKPKTGSEALHLIPPLISLTPHELNPHNLYFKTFASNLLPNPKPKNDINGDIDVALNLSTNSKDKSLNST